MKSTKIPTRDEIAQNDKWDLTSLYLEEADWETDLTLIPDLAKELLAYTGKLAESPETLRNALDTYCRLLMIIETTGSYAFLLTAGDAENAENQDKYGRYMMIATSADAEVSFFVPELQSIDEKLLDQWCQRPDFVDYKIYISKLSRLKPYILSEKEERILSLGAESATACQKSFSMLTNVDIDYGTIKTKNGKMPLTQTTWSSFMENPDREIRKTAYNKFYDAFDNHKNTIASLYAGSVQHDIFEAKARGYKSAREMALFPDKVPETVYDNLVSTVRENLAPLHKYYALRKEMLGLKDLRHYDVYVPSLRRWATLYISGTLPFFAFARWSR